MSGLPEYVTTDELLDGMRRDLRAGGADSHDLPSAIAAELQIPVQWLWCYGQVQVAAERYQARGWVQDAESGRLGNGNQTPRNDQRRK